MGGIQFTHLWVSGFGWENCIYVPDDFDTVDLLGHNSKDGPIFMAINGNAKHILKGRYL